MVEVGHRTECNPEALSAILRFPFLLAPVSWKKEFSLSRSSKGSELNVSGGATDLATMQLNVIRSTFTVAKKKKGNRVYGSTEYVYLFKNSGQSFISSGFDSF